MGENYQEEVNRRISEEERKTIKDYILRLAPFEDLSFRHVANRKAYTVMESGGDLEERWLITTRGKKIPLEQCLSDRELNLGELSKIPEDERI